MIDAPGRLQQLCPSAEGEPWDLSADISPAGPLRSKNRESYPELCSPQFYRELNSFAANAGDEFIVGLDPADLRLIEQLRTGSLCPTNGNYSVFTQEHLDYWTAPYAVEPGVTRRLGNGRIIPAERDERQRAKLAAELARTQRRQDQLERRELTEQEKAIEAAELARAQAEWDIEQEAKRQEREKRLKQTMEADAEWGEAVTTPGSDVGSIAHPYYEEQQREEREYRRVRSFSKTVRNLNSLVFPQRHYVPEWKRAEQARKDWEARAEQREELRRQKAEISMERAALELAEQRAREQAKLTEQERATTHGDLVRRELLAMCSTVESKRQLERQLAEQRRATYLATVRNEQQEGQREYEEFTAKLDRNRLLQVDWLQEWLRLADGTGYCTDDARPDLGNVNVAWMRARTAQGWMLEAIAAQQAKPDSDKLVRVAEKAKAEAEGRGIT